MIVLLIVGLLIAVVGGGTAMWFDGPIWTVVVAVVVGIGMTMAAAITLAGREDEACRKSGGTMQETGHIIMIPIVISTGKTTTVVMSPVPETKCVHQEVQG